MSERPVVQLIDVRKSYGAQQVLKGVNLAIMEGKTTVIVGGSGQGKSQIIKHILGLVRPDSGSVMVFGKEISRVSMRELKEIRTNFGVLFQNAALFDSMTVFDNVALPLRERTKMPEEEIAKVVNEKLAMMDVEGTNDKYPAQLSGGMRKRVGLARALVLDPKIIFFDEPTTGLDVAKSNEIYRVFSRTQTQLGYTAVIVSHDVPKIFKLADYVALLHDGVIQACLTPEEFQLSDDPVIKEFVETTMGPLYSSEMEV
ncbi:MAG: ABC transporter ATP-binding protein [Nitrospiraceae bacterium]|nr:MAG: ABC transporter ATP-binding protein [Nitrospiraceae bacterium]